MLGQMHVVGGVMIIDRHSTYINLLYKLDLL